MLRWGRVASGNAGVASVKTGKDPGGESPVRENSRTSGKKRVLTHLALSNHGGGGGCGWVQAEGGRGSGRATIAGTVPSGKRWRPRSTSKAPEKTVRGIQKIGREGEGAFSHPAPRGCIENRCTGFLGSRRMPPVAGPGDSQPRSSEGDFRRPGSSVPFEIVDRSCRGRRPHEHSQTLAVTPEAGAFQNRPL